LNHDLLCLDLATNIGVARWKEGDDPPSLSTKNLPPIPHLGRFINAYHSFLLEQISINKPTLINYEKPYVGPTMTSLLASKLYGLAAHTDWFCEVNGIAVFCTPPNVWRKHFTGIGSGKRDKLKMATIQECKARGIKVMTEDEADAMGLLDYTTDIKKLKKSWAEGALFKHREN